MAGVTNETMQQVYNFIYNFIIKIITLKWFCPVWFFIYIKKKIEKWVLTYYLTFFIYFDF